MDNQFVWKKTNSSRYELVEKHILNDNDEYELYNKNDDFSISNLSKLKIINIPTIMSVLNQRYDNDIIYTFNGKVLISINPFKSISDLYTKVTVDDIKNPHIYSISELAYRNVYKKNQAILVSGESGSGKTENTKFILKYLSSNYGLDSEISKKIINCNHIIECFGNAKTIKNNNSSRFGKFIKLFLNDKNKIIGANIENYLLEKSRITSYNNLEKSYHIFYFYNSHLLQKYSFSDIYKLISITDDTIIEEFSSPELLLQAFNDFNFTQDEIDTIFIKIKIILELSNVYDSLSMNKVVEKISDDLVSIGISKEELIDKFTKKILKIGNDFIEKKLEYKDSEVAIKSYCEDMYSDMFNSIIKKINEQLGSITDKYISILDIFGFEIFNENGYEQICINYTNEILQNIYNKNVLESEQEEYKKEGVNWNYIEYNSNKSILELFHSKLSLFGIINEQSILSSGIDKNIYSNINKYLKEHPNLNIDKRDVINQQFTVDHYAGSVKYTVKDYILKNRIESKNRKIKTNLQLFVNQLNNLQKELDQCNCLFVRCIKPNDLNVSNNFNYEKIHDQLLYSGVIEGIKLVLKGYPVKIKLDSLDNEFRYIYGSNLDINQIISQHSIEDTKYCFGKSKIFMKRDVYDLLTKEDNIIMEKVSFIITNVFKTWYQRKRFLKMKKASIIIQGQLRRYFAIKELKRLKSIRASIVLQKNVRKYLAYNQYKKTVGAIKLIQKQYRIYKFRQLINILVNQRIRLNKSALIIQRNYRHFIERLNTKREQNMKYINDKLKEDLETKMKENRAKEESYKSKIQEQKEELEKLRILVKNQSSDNLRNSEDIPINIVEDSNIKTQLEQKDREIEKLRKQLDEKSNKKTNLSDSVNEKYIVNNQDEDSFEDVNLKDDFECNNAVQMVGKKLENMYIELNTRNEMMEQLAKRYRLLERQLESEKKKKSRTPSLWEFIFG